jgi:hypothetical protein
MWIFYLIIGLWASSVVLELLFEVFDISSDTSFEPGPWFGGSHYKG